MSNVIKICDKHNIEKSKKISNGSFYCKKCVSEDPIKRYHEKKEQIKKDRSFFMEKTNDEEIIKTCEKHGELNKYQVNYINEKNIRCKLCEREASKKSRLKNSDKSKEYQKQRRLNNLTEFRKRDSEYKRKDYQERKYIYQERTKRYFKNNKDKVRNYRLKKDYNITLDEYNEMFISQNGCCKICNNPETIISSYTKKVKYLAVDHCHTTKKVRSLLCSKCNCLIGYSLENIDILKKAISYLEGHLNG